MRGFTLMRSCKKVSLPQWCWIRFTSYSNHPAKLLESPISESAWHSVIFCCFGPMEVGHCIRRFAGSPWALFCLFPVQDHPLTSSPIESACRCHLSAFVRLV